MKWLRNLLLTISVTLSLGTVSCTDCSRCVGPEDTEVFIQSDALSKLYRFRVTIQTEHGLLDCDNFLENGMAALDFKCPLNGRASPVRFIKSSNTLIIEANYWIQKMEGRLIDSDGNVALEMRILPDLVEKNIPPLSAPSCVRACRTAFFSGTL